MIKEKEKVELKSPILIEGFPGLGEVGRIAVRFLTKQLKAKKLALLYSPYFPYYVIVDKKGSARLLRGQFYFWENRKGGRDIITLTGDSQAQTVQGQYEVASSILDYAKKKGVSLLITLGGYKSNGKETPAVIAVSTDSKLIEVAEKAGATLSSEGNPIVGMAGILIGIAKFKELPALCLLGKTDGYFPDPKAAKNVLQVLIKMLDLDIDLKGLDKEIERANRILEKMRSIDDQRRKITRSIREEEAGKITYIS